MVWEAMTGQMELDMYKIHSESGVPGTTLISERLVMPDFAVRIRTSVDLFFGHRTINGVYIEDDRLIRLSEGVSDAVVENNENLLSQISQRKEPVYLMILPKASSVYLQTDERRQEPLERFRNLSYLTKIDPRQYLSIQSDKLIYYRTEDSMTSLGGYYAYMSAARVLGLQALTLDEFNVRYSSNKFYGQLCTRCGYYNVTPDSCFYYYTASDSIVNAELIDETGAYIWNDRLQEQLLRLKETGESFWTVEINSTAPSGSLLLIADSDGLEMLPYLICHYKTVTVVSTTCGRRLANTKIGETYSTVLVAVNEDTILQENILQ